MTSVILYMLLKDDKSEAAFARFRAVMRSMPTYEVQVEGSDHKRTRLSADMVIEGRKRLLFDAKVPGGHVVFTIGDKGYREVNQPTKTYDELAFKGGVRPVASRISGVPRTIPFWMFGGDLRGTVPPNSKPVTLGKRTVNSYECDHIKVSFKTPIAEGLVEYDIAASGLIYRLFRLTDSPQGHEEFEWTFKDYKPLRAVAASRFENRIPDGFMPYSFTPHPYPPQIGKTLSLTGWIDAQSGKPWVPSSKSATLFVLVSPNSSPSQRAIVSAQKWRHELKSKGIEVVIAADSSDLARSRGLLYSNAPQSLEALGAPATPMFYLLSKSGAVKNLWLGFGLNRGPGLHSEILKAASGLK